MVTLLLVMMMMCNLWVLFYLTWEHRETRKADSREDTGNAHQRPPDDIMGRSKFRMPEKTEAEKDILVPEAATSAKAEAVDEKDVTFADEMETADKRMPETETSHQVTDEELDDVFTDSRVSDIAEYDGDENYDEKPHMAGGFTFEDIDLAVRTVKKSKATGEERRHAGKVFCDMKGNELFAMIEQSSEATRKKLGELMDFYLDSVTVVQATPVRATARKEVPAVPDNIEDFNIRDYV
jgi:hypothetical protein